MKKLFPKIIGLLTVVSMIVGLVNDIPGLIKFAKGDSGNRFSILLSIINNLITDVYALIILGLLFLIALFWLALRRNAKVRGTHGIPVRISVFLRRINPSMIRMIIFAIHNFQHQMTNIIEGLCAKNETRDDIFSDKVKRQTGLLLAEAQKTIQIALRNEISIHIKLFGSIRISQRNFS